MNADLEKAIRGLDDPVFLPITAGKWVTILKLQITSDDGWFEGPHHECKIRMQGHYYYPHFVDTQDPSCGDTCCVWRAG